ncbi:unnamed protein product [Lota lota]
MVEREDWTSRPADPTDRAACPVEMTGRVGGSGGGGAWGNVAESLASCPTKDRKHGEGREAASRTQLPPLRKGPQQAGGAGSPPACRGKGSEQQQQLCRGLPVKRATLFGPQRGCDHKGPFPPSSHLFPPLQLTAVPAALSRFIVLRFAGSQEEASLNAFPSTSHAMS